VPRIWGVNASPLILLGKISALPLLDRLCGQLLVPVGVEKEIFEGPEGDPAIRWLKEKNAESIRPLSLADPIITAWDLGLGESQVLSLARQTPGSEALVDGSLARKCAAAVGISVRGTLGVLLLAKREGHVPRVAPLFQQLTEAGFRIAPDLLEKALRWANER